jgi:hypothetical protein
VLVVLIVTLALATPRPAPAAASRASAPNLTAATTSGVAVDATRPFSAPVWSPLRTPATIACVRTNCRDSAGGAYHGYWAVDFVGRLGDPVYAAGSGIAHIGARQASCSTDGTQSDGVWVWVDHGGGSVTRYHHLDTISITEGQLVTPTTMLGRMGRWGDVAPCATSYLHYEQREGGVKGTRVEPTLLRACVNGATVSMPATFGGARSFDALPRNAYRTPASTSACIATGRTPAKPAFTATRRSGAAALAWGTPPPGTTAVRVATMLWSPSVGAWNSPVYSTWSGTVPGATITGLTNGRTYRMQVAFRNAAGWSAWSSGRSVIPATVPSVPRAPRFLTSPNRTYVHYGWWKSADNGAAVSRYETQVRCRSGATYRPWTTRTTAPSTYYYNHTGLAGYRTCQVRVRAVNAMGASGWSVTSTITKSA